DPKVEVWAIPAKGGGSRAFCDRMNDWAVKEGQPGLGYIFWRKALPVSEIDAKMFAELSQEDQAKYFEKHAVYEGAGPIAKNIGPERTD
ncbi:hypothetical protein ABTM04_20600, partial [Acinetobacter baumannii]